MITFDRSGVNLVCKEWPSPWIERIDNWTTKGLIWASKWDISPAYSDLYPVQNHVDGTNHPVRSREDGEFEEPFTRNAKGCEEISAQGIESDLGWFEVQ